MLGSMAIKKSVKWGRKAFHPLLTIFLLLMICAWSFNPLLHYLYPPEERLYLKKEISKELFLYEIVYIGSAGTPDSYRYYFAGNLDGNPIPILDKEDPFLITNTGDADISYIETDPKGHYLHLLVKYSGRIFLFYNETIAPFSGLHRDILLSLDSSFPIKNDDEDETLKLNKKGGSYAKQHSD